MLKIFQRIKKKKQRLKKFHENFADLENFKHIIDSKDFTTISMILEIKNFF